MNILAPTSTVLIVGLGGTLAQVTIGPDTAVTMAYLVGSIGATAAATLFVARIHWKLLTRLEQGDAKFEAIADQLKDMKAQIAGLPCSDRGYCSDRDYPSSERGEPNNVTKRHLPRL